MIYKTTKEKLSKLHDLVLKEIEKIDNKTSVSEIELLESLELELSVYKNK